MESDICMYLEHQSLEYLKKSDLKKLKIDNLFYHGILKQLVQT